MKMSDTLSQDSMVSSYKQILGIAPSIFMYVLLFEKKYVLFQNAIVFFFLRDFFYIYISSVSLLLLVCLRFLSDVFFAGTMV